MLGAIRTICAAAFAAVALSAHAQSFTFTGAGQVTPTGPPSGTGDLPLMVINSAYDLPGAGTWQLQSSFFSNLNTGMGAGSFTFSQGADSLSGTLTSSAAVVAGTNGFELGYAVTGGTGAYSGRTGSGSGLVQLLDDISGPPPYDYIEAGILTLVPEPMSALLMLGGVVALAGRRRLQRNPRALD
jgi:hypothetical protein